MSQPQLSQPQLQPRRVGMLGGAFDPPHNAHLALAQAALAHARLEVLHIIPSGQSPHRSQPMSPAQHRLRMAQLAFSDLPCSFVDAREIQRPGPSYTSHTLAQLALEYPDASLYLVLGNDQFQALPRWHEPLAVLSRATLLVACRNSQTVQAPPLPPELAAALRWQPLPFTPLPISATALRQQAAQGQGLDAHVPAGVARYIAAHSLYPALPRDP